MDIRRKSTRRTNTATTPGETVKLRRIQSNNNQQDTKLQGQAQGLFKRDKDLDQTVRDGQRDLTDRDKTGDETKQEQDKEKTGTRLGKDRDRNGIRQGQD